MERFWRRRPDRGLAAATVGATVTLGEAELPAADRLRLAELGLRPDAEVRVLARTVGGGRLVGVGTGRVALDRHTARLLAVRADSVRDGNVPDENVRDGNVRDENVRGARG